MRAKLLSYTSRTRFSVRLLETKNPLSYFRFHHPWIAVRGLAVVFAGEYTLGFRVSVYSKCVKVPKCLLIQREHSAEVDELG